MTTELNPPRPKGNALINPGLHSIAVKSVRGRRANFTYYAVLWTRESEVQFRIPAAQARALVAAGLPQITGEA